MAQLKKFALCRGLIVQIKMSSVTTWTGRMSHMPRCTVMAGHKLLNVPGLVTLPNFATFVYEGYLQNFNPHNKLQLQGAYTVWPKAIKCGTIITLRREGFYKVNILLPLRRITQVLRVVLLLSRICSANYSSSYLHFISCIYNNKGPDGHWHVDSKTKYDETNIAAMNKT